jgi:hypothetical protein
MHFLNLNTLCFCQDFKRGVEGYQGKGQGAVLAKKGQYNEKQTEFHSF